MRCHHWHNWHEFEQTLGAGEGQGSLACCSPWGCKEYVCVSHFFSYHAIPWESKNPNILSILVSLWNLLQTRFLLYCVQSWKSKSQWYITVPVTRKSATAFIFSLFFMSSGLVMLYLFFSNANFPCALLFLVFYLWC